MDKNSQHKAKQLVYTLALTILVSICVALVYYYFEAAVHGSINYIWNTAFNTESKRILVVPVGFVLTFIYFWSQHRLDPKSEHHESHGFGDVPPATIKNFLIVICVGYFSLIAGASLGPEAILVPASLIIGSYIGAKLFKSNNKSGKMLAAVGFIALFAAFFSSFWAGMLGLLLVAKQTNTKIKPVLIVLAALSSYTTVFVLSLLSASPYLNMPSHEWHINFASALTVVLLAFVGYVSMYVLGGVHTIFDAAKDGIKTWRWYQKAFVAASGLTLLYLLGGPLVEFTGNESIVPMLQKSAGLGLIGLFWIFVIKIFAIAWSKSFGYRGGLVFPSVFVASVAVAAARLYIDVSFIVGLLAAVFGMLAANQRLKILF